MGSAEFNIYAAKSQFSRLVSRAEQGDRMTITRNGKPVARLVPYVPERPARRPGAWAGLEIPDDLDALTEQDLQDWYGE